jgi:hypothetical protein
MFNSRILLFPYDDNESFPYRSFQRLVPPPPNPPLKTDKEKEEATTHRLSHPPCANVGTVTVGEPTNWVRLHTIFALSYSTIGNSS